MLRSVLGRKKKSRSDYRLVIINLGKITYAVYIKERPARVEKVEEINGGRKRRVCVCILDKLFKRYPRLRKLFEGVE